MRKLKNERTMTYDEVSERLWESEGRKGKKLSKQAIQKIEHRALRKMRESLVEQGFIEAEVVEYLASLSSPVEMEVMQ